MKQLLAHIKQLWAHTEQLWALLAVALLLTAGCSSGRFWIASDFGKDRQIEVLEFEADWCLPCRKMRPVMRMLKNDYPHVVFRVLDYDSASEVSEFGVTKIPYFVVLENGRVRARAFGMRTYRQMARLIEVD